MRLYELQWLLAQPVMPAINGRIRHDLRQLLRESQGRRLRLLDVGGRRSPYTIGLPVDVTVLDIPRQGETRERLNLGLTDQTLALIRRQRSNITEVVIEDMTRCSLPSESFDAITSVEVIEHVPEDERFVEQAARVLRPGGWFYVTTPNGDYCRNVEPFYNPDHVRHYTRQQLSDLLGAHFDDVSVLYGIRTGKHRGAGLGDLSVRRPGRFLRAAYHNVRSRIESRGLERQEHHTAHLFAVARKQ